MGSDLPSIFDTCIPREDILSENFESGLAADIARVADGDAGAEYTDPTRFFAGTYPTNGIRTLLKHVLERLNGKSSSAVFWLDTSFGGGKTHALIALLHAAQSPNPNIMSEFVDAGLLPYRNVKLAVFDGQNADISSGHDIGEGIRARTPWGEIAYRLGGKRGYDRVSDRESDSAPGADTIRDLLGDGPVLILLDELAVYLRKASQHKGAESQFTAFLTSLIKAVEETPNAALIFTLAVSGVGNRVGRTDAYDEENRRLAELRKVAARKAIILNPTEEGETIQVLKRRLFEQCDEDAARKVAYAYKKAWDLNRDKLPDTATSTKTAAEFVASYPLHPEILNTLISKTATLENFQRIRGMLRILGHVVHEVWKHQNKISKPVALHLHHFDMGKEKIRSEIITRAKQDSLVSAIDTDVACDTDNKTSLAQRLDEKHYPGMIPFTTYVARTIMMHSLASLKQLKGIDDKHLRYSILSPGMEIGYIDEALARFKTESLYLDDDPSKPTQFQETPNLNETIRRTEQSLEDDDLRQEIGRRIIKMFQGDIFAVKFPDKHEDVDDGIEKPKLIIPKYEDVSASNPTSPPNVVVDIFEHSGVGGYRINRNNLVFLVAHDDGIETMRKTARSYLARSVLSEPTNSYELVEYQKSEIQKHKKRLDKILDNVILECHKYVLYPHKNGKLTHDVMNWRGSDGESQIVEKLRHIGKMRKANDEPDDPESLVDRINELGTTGKMTTRRFRNEFYQNPELPLLVDDSVFVKGIERGIEQGVFVYKRDDLVRGRGDAACVISIDDDSIVYTIEKARESGVWPLRKERPTSHEETRKKSGSDEPTDPDPSIYDLETRGTPYDAIQDILGKLRVHNVSNVSKVQIVSEDDIFPLLTYVDRIKSIAVRVEIEGDYRTASKGIFRFAYKGKLEQTEEEREFLRNQLKNTDVPNIKVKFQIDFGASVSVDKLGELAEHLKPITVYVVISNVVV